jgi:hypothetical protein
MVASSQLWNEAERKLFIPRKDFQSLLETEKGLWNGELKYGRFGSSVIRGG